MASFEGEGLTKGPFSSWDGVRGRLVPLLAEGCPVRFFETVQIQIQFSFLRYWFNSSLL